MIDTYVWLWLCVLYIVFCNHLYRELSFEGSVIIYFVADARDEAGLRVAVMCCRGLLSTCHCFNVWKNNFGHLKFCDMCPNDDNCFVTPHIFVTF